MDENKSPVPMFASAVNPANFHGHKQKKSPVLYIILIFIVVGAAFTSILLFQGNKPGRGSSQTKVFYAPTTTPVAPTITPVQLTDKNPFIVQEENPFVEPTEYQNPFTDENTQGEYQNPFDE